MAYNETAPDYTKIGQAYLYARIFVLLHNPSTVTVEQMFAWGDALGVRRDYWAAQLVYYGACIDAGTDPSLICPANAQWQAGYQAARAYAATDPTPTDGAAFAAAQNVSFPLFIAGYAYYAFDEVTEPDLSGVGLLAVLVNLLTHL